MGTLAGICDPCGNEVMATPAEGIAHGNWLRHIEVQVQMIDSAFDGLFV